MVHGQAEADSYIGRQILSWDKSSFWSKYNFGGFVDENAILGGLWMKNQHKPSETVLVSKCFLKPIFLTHTGNQSSSWSELGQPDGRGKLIPHSTFSMN